MTNPTNSTAPFDFFDWFEDSTARILFAGQVALDFIGMGFMINAFNSFSASLGILWPTGFSDGLIVIFAILFALWIIYMISGRSTSGMV